MFSIQQKFYTNKDRYQCNLVGYFLISHSDHLINQKLLIDKTNFLDYLFVMKKFMEFIGGQIALAYLIIFIMLVIALFFI